MEQVLSKAKEMKLSFNIFISREIFQNEQHRWTLSQRMTRGLAPFSGKYDDQKQISAVPEFFLYWTTKLPRNEDTQIMTHT